MVTALGTVVVVVEVVLVVVVSAGLMHPTTGTVETVGSADGAHRIGRLVEVVVVAAEAVNAGAQSHHSGSAGAPITKPARHNQCRNVPQSR